MSNVQGGRGFSLTIDADVLHEPGLRWVDYYVFPDDTLRVDSRTRAVSRICWGTHLFRRRCIIRTGKSAAGGSGRRCWGNSDGRRMTEAMRPGWNPALPGKGLTTRRPGWNPALPGKGLTTRRPGWHPALQGSALTGFWYSPAPPIMQGNKCKVYDWDT